MTNLGKSDDEKILNSPLRITWVRLQDSVSITSYQTNGLITQPKSLSVPKISQMSTGLHTISTEVSRCFIQVLRYYYYYYLYLYLLYVWYSLVRPRETHVSRGYIVAATLSFYCQYGVWCKSPSFLSWFWWSPTSAFPGECVQCLIWLFSVVPELHGFLVCCPRISQITSKWCQSLQLLLLSPLFSHSTYVEFLL